LADVAENQFGHAPVISRAWVEPDASAHIARELHDGVAGELSAMLLDLERFRQDQFGRQGVLAEITTLQEHVRGILMNVRSLLNDQRGLPGVDPDLIGSLRRHLVRRFADRTGLRIHLSVSPDWPGQLPAETSRQLHRIVQEALNNVDRHSGAGCVLIRFAMNRGAGVVRVLDDGRGYDDADGSLRGLGLLGIEERATMLGGRVVISNRARGGTVLSVTVPRRSLGL
jgi:two-component system NarL family sensor kinase